MFTAIAATITLFPQILFCKYDQTILI